MSRARAKEAMLRAVTPCGVHLRGNVQCPYPALYVVQWAAHSYPVDEQLYRRAACAHHLSRAIEDALDEQRRDLDTVRVGLI